MSKHSVLSLFVPLCVGGLTAAAAAASVSVQPTAGNREARLNAVDSQQKTWFFSGTVRYVSDITGKETQMGFSGITAEMSRDQAMEFAKESGAAQGARWGRVVSVNVSSLF